MSNLIPPKQLQEKFNRSAVTIWRWWAKEKILPPPVMVQGQAIGWRPEVIEQWLIENEGV